MAHKENPANPEPGKKPARQTGETKGPVNGEQVTEDNMRRKDLPRGSQREPFVQD